MKKKIPLLEDDECLLSTQSGRSTSCISRCWYGATKERSVTVGLDAIVIYISVFLSNNFNRRNVTCRDIFNHVFNFNGHTLPHQNV